MPLVPSDLERGMSMPALERETFQLALYSHNFPPHADSQNLLEKTFFSGEQKYLNALMRTLNSVSPALTGAMRSCSRTNIFCPITGEKEKKNLSFPGRFCITLFLKSPSLFITSSRDTLLLMESIPALKLGQSFVIAYAPSFSWIANSKPKNRGFPPFGNKTLVFPHMACTVPVSSISITHLSGKLPCSQSVTELSHCSMSSSLLYLVKI